MIILAGYGLIAAVVAIIAAVIAVATTIFSFSIMSRVNDKRDDLNSKVDAIINKEIENYKTEKPTNKRLSLKKVTILEGFRTTLSDADDIVLFGYLYLLVCLGYVVVVLILGQFIPISLNTLSNSNPPLPQLVMIMLFELAIISPFPALSKFNQVWNLGRVHTRHYNKRDDDLAKCIFMFFEHKPLFKKSELY